MNTREKPGDAIRRKLLGIALREDRIGVCANLLQTFALKNQEDLVGKRASKKYWINGCIRLWNNGYRPPEDDVVWLKGYSDTFVRPSYFENNWREITKEVNTPAGLWIDTRPFEGTKLGTGRDVVKTQSMKTKSIETQVENLNDTNYGLIERGLEVPIMLLKLLLGKK